MENVFEPMASFNQDVFEPLENFNAMDEALIKASEEARDKSLLIENLSNSLKNRNLRDVAVVKADNSSMIKNPNYKMNMQKALLNLVLRKTGISTSNFYGWFDSLDIVRKNRNQQLRNLILTKSSNLSSLEDKIINALSMYKSKYGKVFELDLPLFITNEESRFELKKQCAKDKKNKFFFDPKKTRNRIRDCQMSVDSQIDSKYSNFDDDYSNFGILDKIRSKFRDLKSRKNLRISSFEHPLNFLINRTDLIDIKGAIKTSNFDGDEYFDGNDFLNFDEMYFSGDDYSSFEEAYSNFGWFDNFRKKAGSFLNPISRFQFLRDKVKEGYNRLRKGRNNDNKELIEKRLGGIKQIFEYQKIVLSLKDKKDRERLQEARKKYGFPVAISLGKKILEQKNLPIKSSNEILSIKKSSFEGMEYFDDMSSFDDFDTFEGDEYFDGDDFSNFGLVEWFKSKFGKKDISTQSTPSSTIEEKKVFGMPRKTAIGVGAGLIAVGITAFFLIKKKK